MVTPFSTVQLSAIHLRLFSKGYWTLLISLISVSVFAADFTVELDKNQTEMGKFMIATIRYMGDVNPGPVNLSEWQELFYVDKQDAEISELSDGKIETETKARLYPRQSGQFELSSLALGGEIAQSQPVIVTPSIRNNIDATPVLQGVQPDYWADQAIIVTVDMMLHEAGNNVIASDFDVDGFVTRTFPQQRLLTQAGTMVRLQWMLLTPTKGRYVIDLPSIQQRGRGRFRYYLPKLTVNINPLPGYLPSTIPVGEIKLQSKLVKESKQPALWTLTIENSGRLPTHIEGLQIFFDRQGIVAQDVSVENQLDSTSDKVMRQYQIQLPQWSLGGATELTLPYFDTKKGRLAYLNHRLPDFWNIPKYALIGGVFLLMLIGFYMARQIDKLAQHIRLRRSFRLNIKQTSSANQLRKLLLSANNFSHLSDWAEHYKTPSAQLIAMELNALCFAQESNQSIDRVKALCLDFCRSSNFHSKNYE